MSQPGPEGLQAERTALAWSRTSMAVLLNGVLLVLKEPRNAARPLAAVLAVVVAVTIYVVGIRRQRTLARDPLPAHVTARRQVHLVGIAVLVLVAVTVIGLYL